MTKFKSDPVVIQAEDKGIYAFLENFNNFEKLMPEQVINWKSDKERCSFTIKGMADLAMRIDQKEAYNGLSYASEGKSPFPFTLKFSISDEGNSTSKIVAVLEAKLNSMLKMMASRPLQNFVNLLTAKLKEVIEGH